MLRSNPVLIEEYDQTFKVQLEKDIIEEVPADRFGDGDIVHYIPHQPVLTPRKDTIKRRIVFDASSHFKGSPSLNDALHQGPLILPELYAMLLLFRISKVAVIADDEKAFLQVTLTTGKV